MYGFLYRNWRLLRPMRVALCISLFYTILAPIFAALNLSTNNSELSEYRILCCVCYAMNMIMGYFAQSEFNKADEKRLPIAFAISTPAGVNGYVKSRYLSNLLLPFTMLTISNVTDTIVCAIVDFNTNEIVPTSFMSLTSALFLVIMFFNAIEQPFMMRFGVKKGGSVKAAVFLSILAAVGIYLLFGDISMFGSFDDFLQFLLDVMNGQRGGTTLAAIMALAPFITLALYYLSYLLSCKLFLKGVEQLEQ